MVAALKQIAMDHKPAVPAPGGGRFRAAVASAALGGVIGAPVGLLQDAIIEMLPEEDKKQWNEKIAQTEQIVMGTGECTVGEVAKP
jgi:hypothetical protein